MMRENENHKALIAFPIRWSVHDDIVMHLMIEKTERIKISITKRKI